MSVKFYRQGKNVDYNLKLMLENNEREGAPFFDVPPLAGFPPRFFPRLCEYFQNPATWRARKLISNIYRLTRCGII